MQNIFGIILLNKPLGISSNLALQKVKRLLNIKKAGHTGSLDPSASGMLPICIGQATKFSHFLLNAKKKYDAILKLGEVSSTGDEEGDKTVVTTIKKSLDIDIIQQALKKFIGKIQQVPPMYSALKHKGQPLYKFARQGIDIPRVARDIEIYGITIKSYSIDILELEIECSKGTYIRTLAEDIGKALGTGAYLSALHRTGVGSFMNSSMYTLEQIEAIDSTMINNYLVPVERAIDNIDSVIINDLELKKIIYGQKVQKRDFIAQGDVKIMHSKYGLVGIGAIKENNTLIPKRLLQFDLATL